MKKIHQFKYLVVFIFSLFLVLGSLSIFAAEEAVEDKYNLISIVFLIIDIVEVIALYVMIKSYQKLKATIGKQKSLLVSTLGLFLLGKSFFVIALILAIILFLLICEYAYLIHLGKEELKAIKIKSSEKEEEIKKIMAGSKISYTMSVDDWYSMEKEECIHQETLGESVVLYINKEIEKEKGCTTPDHERIEALENLLKEYK